MKQAIRHLMVIAMVIICLARNMIAPIWAADEARDREEFTQFQQNIENLLKDDPPGALSEYKRFWRDHPNLSPSVGVLLCTVGADIYYRGLKNINGALAVCDWGLNKYVALTSSVRLISTKANILVASNNIDEAETLYLANWQRIVQADPPHSNPVLRDYATLLQRPGRQDDLISIIEKSFVAAPAFLDDKVPEWHWRYNVLTDALLQQNRTAEALSWATLRFATCDYSADAVSAAARGLAKVWMAYDANRQNVSPFVMAQTDLRLSNPLQDVPLPQVNLEDVKAIYNRLPKDRTGIHDRISLLLLVDRPRDAMGQALPLLNDPASQKEGVREVCRVFKANDLRLQRANAFLTYMKTGTGPNPITEFLQEPPHHKRPMVKPTAAVPSTTSNSNIPDNHPALAPPTVLKDGFNDPF